MKKIILTLLFILNSLGANDFINIPLSDYISIVSKSNNINIVIDDNIDSSITFLISRDLRKETYFEVLKNLLINKNLDLKKFDNFYMITKKIVAAPDTPLEFFYNSIKLNFIKFTDIENFLKVYGENIKYEFINSSKLLVIYSTKKDFDNISSYVKKIDILPKQLKLKITIIDTNIDKVKELGTNFNFNQDDTSSFFFNLIAYPFTINNDISNTQKSSFYSFLKFVNSNGATSLLSSPILTLSDNKKVNFDVATNIPYEIGNTVINEDTSKTVTAINYKDVGLKIELLPTIYSNDLLYIDLNLEVSNIITNNDNTPITSNKRIKQSFYLDTKKIFVLTGINQSNEFTSTSGIPLLMDLNYIGWLFKYQTNNLTNSNLSIFLEVINDDIESSLSNDKTFDNTLEDSLKNYKSLHNQRVKEIIGF